MCFTDEINRQAQSYLEKYPYDDNAVKKVVTHMKALSFRYAIKCKSQPICMCLKKFRSRLGDLLRDENNSVERYSYIFIRCNIVNLNDKFKIFEQLYEYIYGQQIKEILNNQAVGIKL